MLCVLAHAESAASGLQPYPRMLSSLGALHYEITISINVIQFVHPLWEAR